MIHHELNFPQSFPSLQVKSEVTTVAAEQQKTQSCSSSQPPASTLVAAENKHLQSQQSSQSQSEIISFAAVSTEGQSHKSPQQPAGIHFTVPYYVFDPNGGIMLPDGSFVLTGVGVDGQPIKDFSMEQAVKKFALLPPLPIFSEYGKFANNKGWTPDIIRRLQQMGHTPRLESTRHAGKGREKTCEEGHGVKVRGCPQCTKRDLRAMQRRAEKCLSDPFVGEGENRTGGKYNGMFYVPRFNRMGCGSKNVSGTPSAIVNTELNNARFEHPTPYASVLREAPGLLESFSLAPAIQEQVDTLWKQVGQIPEGKKRKRTLKGVEAEVKRLQHEVWTQSAMAAATIIIVARVAVRLGFGVRRFRRLLADNYNSRKCQPYSNIAFHFTGDRKAFSKTAKNYFKKVKAKMEVRQIEESHQEQGVTA